MQKLILKQAVDDIAYYVVPTTQANDLSALASLLRKRAIERDGSWADDYYVATLESA